MTAPTPTHPNLLEVDEAPRYGVPIPFYERFRPRTIELVIATAGALGTMAIGWRERGAADWVNDNLIVSDAGSEWVTTIAPAFAKLTFAPGSYVGDTIYTVTPAGIVTPGVGAIDGLTAERWDMRETGCRIVTGEALALMKDGVRLPLISWGPEIRRHAAAMLHAWLKTSTGLTPNGAGTGDENIFTAEQSARRFFADIGNSVLRPPDLVDSAATEDGPVLHYPVSDEPRGWDHW